jgi:hypothetical protein
MKTHSRATSKIWIWCNQQTEHNFVGFIFVFKKQFYSFLFFSGGYVLISVVPWNIANTIFKYH